VQADNNAISLRPIFIASRACSAKRSILSEAGGKTFSTDGTVTSSKREPGSYPMIPRRVQP
jgi:hypothetical protein